MQAVLLLPARQVHERLLLRLLPLRAREAQAQEHAFVEGELLGVDGRGRCSQRLARAVACPGRPCVRHAAVGLRPAAAGGPSAGADASGDAPRLPGDPVLRTADGGLAADVGRAAGPGRDASHMPGAWWHRPVASADAASGAGAADADDGGGRVLWEQRPHAAAVVVREWCASAASVAAAGRHAGHLARARLLASLRRARTAAEASGSVGPGSLQ
mmetsp:Transcript_92957/g.236464  ORF Transcript_92957/g.236464 Transcript_92957/m.236464 type:complete len:215 (-) Transcript_92957:435-1079(-)